MLNLLGFFPLSHLTSLNILFWNLELGVPLNCYYFRCQLNLKRQTLYFSLALASSNGYSSPDPW